MDNLQRITGKIFGETATVIGDDPQIGQFGSALAGTYIGTTDVATIQNLAAWSNGFIDSVTPSTQFPPLPEMTGFGKVLSYQQNYLLQKGVAEWDAGTTYYAGDLCKAVGSSTIYESLIDNNLNNALTDINSWNIYSSVSDDRLHALKSYEDAGELLTDSEGLADVKEYTHSTFDISKFYVVGSPTITDGIASGFSSSNFLKLLLTPSTSKYTFKFKYKPTTSTSVDGYVLGYWNQFIQIYTNGSILSFYVANTSESFTIGSISLDLNSEYNITFDVDFVTGTATVNYTKDGTAMTPITGSISGTPKTGTELYIGSGTNISAIDLKQFSITVDGIEVFSGNKTGIDTIKPDDYTAVGTPTISADGIYTGTPSAYLTSTINGLSSATKYAISLEYTPSRVDTWGWIIYPDNHTGLGLLQESGIVYLCEITNSTSFTKIANVNLTLNTKTIVEITVDGTSYNFKATTNGAEQSSSGTFTNAFTSNILWVGNYPGNATDGYTKGSIDLNAFKIYVDGNLVYQPCLKIPYTLSKTGSKIVDAVYRNRVSDMYNQFGYAPYYTLSDSDFTLPMGELYGMMLNQSTPHIVETYYNNGSGYILYSNKYCEQWGITAENTTITFLKPFADNKYIITALSYADGDGANYVMYNTKTSTTMVLQVGADSWGDNLIDWRVCGYIA